MYFSLGVSTPRSPPPHPTQPRSNYGLQIQQPATKPCLKWTKQELESWGNVFSGQGLGSTLNSSPPFP